MIVSAEYYYQNTTQQIYGAAQPYALNCGNTSAMESQNVVPASIYNTSGAIYIPEITLLVNREFTGSPESTHVSAHASLTELQDDGSYHESILQLGDESVQQM